MKNAQFSEGQVELALYLWKIGAFLDKARSPEGGGFLLKKHEADPNEPLSPFYINLRISSNPKKPGPLDEKAIKMIASEMKDLVGNKHIKFDYFAGIPRAGDPFALSFCEQYAEAKMLKFNKIDDDGSGKRKIGTIVDGGEELKGKTCLGIDDLATHGNTKIEWIEQARDLGLTINDIVVLIDREMGGVELMQANGVKLHAVFKISELLKLYLEMKLFSEDEYEIYKSYSKKLL